MQCLFINKNRFIIKNFIRKEVGDLKIKEHDQLQQQINFEKYKEMNDKKFDELAKLLKG
jgi:hypothetical protein